MKRVFVLLLAVVVIGALILGGCTKKTTTTTTIKPTQTSTSTSTSTTTTTTTSEAPHKVLKIGSVIGLNSTTGIEQKKWFDLLAKLVNEQGGWKIGADTYDIEMIVYDSQNDAATGKKLLEKLVLQDGVKFVFGSATNNPATDAEVTEPNKVICMGLDVIGFAADPKIQYYYTPMGMAFSRGFVYIVYNEFQAKGAKNYVSLKSDDMMGRFTDVWGNATWAVAAPNVKYLETVFYDPTTTDYGPVATKVMSLNPDVIDAAFALVSASAYNALYDLGFKGFIFPTIEPPAFETVKTHTGNAWVEGWEFTLADTRLYPNIDPSMQVYYDAYTAEYGEYHTDGASWLAPWFLLKSAIDATQSVDTDVLKAYLDNDPPPVMTLSGWCKLFARPELGNFRTISGVPAIYMGIVKDGQVVPYKPCTIKDHYLATILSNNLVDVYKAYWEQYGYPTFPEAELSTIKFSDLGITGHD